MWLLVFGIVAVVVWYFIRKNFKTPMFGSMCVVTGGLKQGKSTFSLYLAYRTFKRNRRSVRFMNYFRKMFNKPLQEEPLFYSTIPVGFPHVRITQDLIMRKQRFAYKSVVWIDEASLLADSSLYKDQVINAKLLEFCKLFGHETKGGCLFLVTHDIAELHHSMRRVCSESFYVDNTFKWLPFFMIVTVRQERYSESGTIMNNYNEDMEDSMKKVIVPKSIWKKFDCYCYSSMTDDLPVDGNIIKTDNLKTDYVESFSPLHRYKKEKKEEIEENEKKSD